jgi:NAD(P)H-flavin reductase
MDTFSAHVSRIRNLTYDVREIELTLQEPGQIYFAPGQFVSFEIDRPGFPVPATRPYSIASSPSSRQAIQLVLNHVPGGPGSDYLFALREGDMTTFRGPVGTFTLRDSQRDLLFVATGTGIGPIRSMLRSLAEASSHRTVTLYWGLRSERDLYYQDEFARLREQMPHFSCVTTLSRPVGAWHGVVGWVSPLVESQITDVSNLDVFLCGNAAMIRDVRDILRKRGLCPIHTEQYYDDRTTTCTDRGVVPGV